VSLVRAVSIGTLVGAAAALSIYATVGPNDLGQAAAPVSPTFAPVPTPTVTQLADCVAPAVLKKGVCVTAKPGPTVVVQDTPQAQTTAPRGTTPAAAVPAQPAEEDEDDEDEDED